MIVVRYADDLVVGFEHEGDARRFLDAMRDRLGEFAPSPSSVGDLAAGPSNLSGRPDATA